ncbi:MAG: UDP-N-acetylmuramate dehydrogenase, partial [Candidatus Rokuibacteriota bacterium]
MPLAPYCTLGVGGPARYFVEARDETMVQAALAWARRRGLAVRVIGGGSNLLVADEGVEALVIRIASRGVVARRRGLHVVVTAAAGEPWDALVGRAVERGWAGLECLSGIPGSVGATPIQNVGAYGQEVSETVIHVRALDTRDGRVLTMGNHDCRFTYRDSIFKSGEPERWVVLAVQYRLRPGGAPTIRYAELERHLGAHGSGTPSLTDVRASVLAIRRSKSMVIEAGDENQRSCGSFFTNPLVTVAEAAKVQAVAGDPTMPQWPQPDGRVKLAAGWLIERAGFARGLRDGPVGLSTR